MLPPGCIVTMITPFAADGSIDYGAIDSLIEWYIASGCVGIFMPCLSSEMFDLTDNERLELAERVSKRVAGRIVVVATGTYGGPIEMQAKTVNAMAAHCDAVVVNTACLVSKDEDDAAWRAAASQLLELTGSVALGLYECPVPYKRLLSPELIKWCAETHRFHFHKDTCCSMEAITAKLAAVASAGGKDGGTPFRFYNANVETLLPSLRAGGHGFSGISANFYPHLHAWLCKAARDEVVADDSPAKRRRSSGSEANIVEGMRKIQDFLSLAEATVCVNYPASAKAYLHQASGGKFLQTIKCRTKGHDGLRKGEHPFVEHQAEALEAMWRMQADISKEFGIKCPPPPTV